MLISYNYYKLVDFLRDKMKTAKFIAVAKIGLYSFSLAGRLSSGITTAFFI